MFLLLYGAYTAYLVLDAIGHDSLEGFTLVLVLFLVKITGFVAAGLLCLAALAAGRIRLFGAIASAVIFAAALGGLELATGMISAYLADIVALLDINDSSLASRLIQGASRTGGTVIFAAASFVGTGPSSGASGAVGVAGSSSRAVSTVTKPTTSPDARCTATRVRWAGGICSMIVAHRSPRARGSRPAR